MKLSCAKRDLSLLYLHLESLHMNRPRQNVQISGKKSYIRTNWTGTGRKKNYGKKKLGSIIGKYLYNPTGPETQKKCCSATTCFRCGRGARGTGQQQAGQGRGRRGEGAAVVRSSDGGIELSR